MKLEIISNTAKKLFNASTLTDGDITLTTERGGVAGKLEFTIIKNGEISYLEGDQVSFEVSPSILAPGFETVNAFRGYVFKKVKAQNSIKTTAYDQLVYLRQSKQSYNIENMTVNEVINMIAEEYGLLVGDLTPVSYKLPLKLYDSKSLLDIISDCIDRTNVATGKIHVFYDDFGKLTLKEATNMQYSFVIGDRSLATDYEYTTSLEDTYNFIKLVQANEKTKRMDSYIVQDSESMKDWGKLQYYEKVDENLNAAQIQELAKKMFDFYDQRRRKLKISAIGVPGVRAGCMILIEIPGIGDIDLVKMLLVDKCTHHITSSSHTMDLEMEVYSG